MYLIIVLNLIIVFKYMYLNMYLNIVQLKEHFLLYDISTFVIKYYIYLLFFSCITVQYIKQKKMKLRSSLNEPSSVSRPDE